MLYPHREENPSNKTGILPTIKPSVGMEQAIQVARGVAGLSRVVPYEGFGLHLKG